MAAVKSSQVGKRKGCVLCAPFALQKIAWLLITDQVLTS
jgi:hypothetical protein